MRLATSPWSPLHAIYPTEYSAGEMLRVNFEVPSYGTTPILAGSAQGRAASTSRHGVDRSSLLIFFPTPLCSGAVLGHTRYIRTDISNFALVVGCLARWTSPTSPRGLPARRPCRRVRPPWHNRSTLNERDARTDRRC